MVIDLDAPWGGGRSLHLDEAGRAQVDGLLVGRYVVRLHEDGLVSTSASAEVREAGVARADLVEPEGGSVDVVLVDGEGRPLPFGTLSVGLPSNLTWLDVTDEGVQRIDGFTDRAGRRVLDHVESGEVEISASWASRTAKATLWVADRGRVVARIVLRVPEEPEDPKDP